MSVANKLVNLGKASTPSLEEFQGKLQEEIIKLKGDIRKKSSEIKEQRKVCMNQHEMFNDDVTNAEEKLKMLKEEKDDLQAEYKDDIEVYKIIEQILKVREEKKTAKANRWYSGLGTFAIMGGIGLAYGSDTFSTLINKHTLDAVKMALTRLLPKPV